MELLNLSNVNLFHDWKESTQKRYKQYPCRELNWFILHTPDRIYFINHYE